jgi:hypothetical protein
MAVGAVLGRASADVVVGLFGHVEQLSCDNKVRRGEGVFAAEGNKEAPFADERVGARPELYEVDNTSLALTGDGSTRELFNTRGQQDIQVGATHLPRPFPSRAQQEHEPGRPNTALHPQDS